MLEILKQPDRSTYLDIIKGLGIDEESAQISESIDDGRVTGYSVYCFERGSIVVYTVSPADDLLLADGILRSVLFLAVLRGVESARLYGDAESAAIRLGYALNDGLLEPISGLFGGCEGCGHNKHRED